MIIDKYTFWRKGLFHLQALLPFAKRAKNISVWLKSPHYAGKVRKMRRIVADALAATGRHPLFSQIEIETFNRCNGECSFCPVNRHIDPRAPVRMSEDLFRSILSQLRELEFTGTVSLYSNNEPLLDDRIVEFSALARDSLPGATILFYTNGKLLNLDLYTRLIPHLDYMIINNYCDDFIFRPNIQEIIDYSSRDPVLDTKTRVTMRYINEVMTSRGGASPNKRDILPATKPYGCLLPLKQVVVRSDGKLSLCCNDALGQFTLGDLATEPLLDIWNREENRLLREKIMDSREATPLCRHCDTFL